MHELKSRPWSHARPRGRQPTDAHAHADSNCKDFMATYTKHCFVHSQRQSILQSGHARVVKFRPAAEDLLRLELSAPKNNTDKS
jgi:hypothetical protein